MQHNYWRFDEDKMLIKENDLDKLKDLMKYRLPRVVTARRNRLRRLNYTLEKLEYEENFIKEGCNRLTNIIMAEHLKIEERVIRRRIRVIDKGCRSQDKLEVSDELKKAMKYDSDKNIMKEFDLKDYELAVRKLILIDEKRDEQRKENVIKAVRKRYEIEDYDEELKKKLQDRLPPGCIKLKDLVKKKYKKGNKYLVEFRTDSRRLQDRINFEGKLIQETDRNIVLKNRKGRIESFLKIDFLIGEGRIKEV